MRDGPDDQEQQRVCTQPRDGRGHKVVEEEDAERAEELAKVGPADEDLRVGRDLEDLFCDERGDAGLEVAVAVERYGVAVWWWGVSVVMIHIATFCVTGAAEGRERQTQAATT